MPLELRRWWSFWPNYTDVDPASTTICVDGEIGTVLKTYREVNMPHMKRSSADLLFSELYQLSVESHPGLLWFR